MDDRTFHDLVDALERGDPLPEDLDANDVAALAMARQLFDERQELPAAMAERRWTAETTQATAATAARRDGDSRRRLFGVRWLPELALLSLIAVLGLVMVLGARRGGMPAQGGETPVGATAAPASWLSGRMLFVQHILDDSTLSALDVRTGKTEVLWSVPSGSEPESAWMHTSSPDGTLVAYRLHRAGDTDVSPQRLAVRRTLQGAEATVLELPANAGETAAIVRMIWTPGSNHLYYANIVVHELDGAAVLGAFELHRLAVTQDSLGTVVLGPDERLWRLDGERLQGAIGTIPDGLIDVAAVHEPSGRAVLLAGDLERKVHAIQVVDLATGEELARVPTGGENVEWAATQDGSRLAFVDCTQCDTAVPVRVRRLDVAMAGDPAAIVDVGVTTASLSLGLVWSPSNRWLAFADVGGVRVVHDPTEPGVTPVPERWLSATNDQAVAEPTSDHEARVLPVVFSSQGDIVVTNALGLYDPTTDTSFELPWSTRDNAIADHIGGGRGTFLGWVPDESAPVAARETEQIERALPTTEPAEPGLEGLHGDDYLASTALAVAGERAFVGFGDLLAVLDLRNPRAPGLIDDALQPIPDPYQVITDIAVAGDLAYLALRPQGLAILDLSTPWSEIKYPSVADSMEARPGQGQLPMSRLAIAGQHLYGVRERDVVIVDISEPAQPVEGQTLPSGAPVLDVAVSGDTLLVLDTAGLTSYALANPDRPRRLGRMPMPGGEPPSAGSVRAVPGTEFVLVGLSGATPAAWLVDLSDAAQPQRVGDLHVGAGVEALVVGAGRAFVATDAGGSSSSEITAYDISNPAAPRQLGRPVYLDDDVAELAEAGGVLFVATANHGLKALAVDDPSDMSWIALDSADEPSISALRLTPVPLPSPIATGPLISNDSWSPDGRWLAYWQAVDEQPDGGLHLFNVETRQRCDQEAVTAYLYERGDPIDWLPGGEIHVVGWKEGLHYLGQPCAGPLPTLDVAGKPTPTPSSERGALSPEGAYRATTELLGTDTTESTEKWRTQLVRNADAQVMATVDWDSAAKMRPDLGGEWLPDGRFLLSEDRARGPLLLDERGIVTEVATTWFKLGRDRQRSELRAGLVRGTGDKDWHVLLTSQELEDTAWLFHPETSSAEQLTLGSPSSSQYIPAPRGWLADRDRSGQVSVRPLDPAGAAFTPLAAATDLSGPSPDYLALRWSPDGTRAVLAGTLPSGAGEVRLISFPDGIVRSRWPLATPFNSPVFLDWSRDNRHVAVYVMAADQKREALYVLDAGVREAGR